jgi:hypothetical protein
MSLRSVLLFSLVVALGTLPTMASEEEEPAPWDQERVMTLAAELDVTMKGLREELRKVGPPDAWNHYLATDTLRVIARESRHLHRELAARKGRDETRPTFARIVALRNDCDFAMRKTPILRPALEKLAKTRSILHEMAPYYGFDPDTDDHTWILGP